MGVNVIPTGHPDEKKGRAVLNDVSGFKAAAGAPKLILLGYWHSIYYPWRTCSIWYEHPAMGLHQASRL